MNAGNSRTALTILEAVTDELIEGWDRVEDVIGDAEEFFSELGARGPKHSLQEI